MQGFHADPSVERDDLEEYYRGHGGNANEPYKSMLRKQRRLLPSAEIASVEDLEGTIYSRHNRKMVVDWMVEVAKEQRWAGTTLHSAVHLIDYIVVNNTTRIPLEELQLAALVALWVVMKLDEPIRGPSLRAGDMNRLTNYTYRVTDVLEMERQILSFTDFRLIVPTALHFLTLFQSALASATAPPRALLTPESYSGGSSGDDDRSRRASMASGSKGATLVVHFTSSEGTAIAAAGVRIKKGEPLSVAGNDVASRLGIPSPTSLRFFEQLSGDLGDLTYCRRVSSDMTPEALGWESGQKVLVCTNPNQAMLSWYGSVAIPKTLNTAFTKSCTYLVDLTLVNPEHMRFAAIDVAFACLVVARMLTSRDYDVVVDFAVQVARYHNLDTSNAEEVLQWVSTLWSDGSTKPPVIPALDLWRGITAVCGALMRPTPMSPVASSCGMTSESPSVISSCGRSTAGSTPGRPPEVLSPSPSRTPPSASSSSSRRPLRQAPLPPTRSGGLPRPPPHPPRTRGHHAMGATSSSPDLDDEPDI